MALIVASGLGAARPSVPRRGSTELSDPRAMVVCMETRYCPGCRDKRVVEQPPCADGHLECPEWACIECGTAITIGWLATDAPKLTPARRSRAA